MKPIDILAANDALENERTRFINKIVFDIEKIKERPWLQRLPELQTSD